MGKYVIVQRFDKRWVVRDVTSYVEDVRAYASIQTFQNAHYTKHHYLSIIGRQEYVCTKLETAQMYVLLRGELVTAPVGYP